jgi:Ca2+-transporting ATPase
MAEAATMGFVVFSLFNVAIGLSARYEKLSIFNRDILSDRRQLLLFGLALLLTFLPTELGFGQRILGLTPLTLNQWLLCIGLAAALLVIDEIVKAFLRRRREEQAPKAQALAPVPNP